MDIFSKMCYHNVASFMYVRDWSNIIFWTNKTFFILRQFPRKPTTLLMGFRLDL